MARSEADFIAIQEDIVQLKKDMVSLRDNVGAFGSDKADELRSAAQERIEALRAELDMLTVEMGKQGRRGVASAEEAVRENPLVAVLLAFVAGLVASLFMSRR